MAIVGNPALKTLEDMKNVLYNNILLTKALTRWWNFSKYTAIVFQNETHKLSLSLESKWIDRKIDR